MASRITVRSHFNEFTNQRYLWIRRVDEAIKTRNCTKSRVRATAEHTIGVIKRVLGFHMVRHRHGPPRIPSRHRCRHRWLSDGPF